MYFVYFLRSKSNPEKTYIGQTSNLVARLEQHNTTERRTHTMRYRPWKVEAFILADTKAAAVKAERYFKSPSGKEKFERFAQVNPEHPNPIEGFFSSQNPGRTFGRSQFKVKQNRIVVLTKCAK